MAMGRIAGYVGGKVDTVITALIDLTWGFPLLLVAVIFAGILEPGSGVVIAVAIVVWAGFARIVRAQVKGLASASSSRRRARSACADWKILLGTCSPTCWAPCW